MIIVPLNFKYQTSTGYFKMSHTTKSSNMLFVFNSTIRRPYNKKNPIKPLKLYSPADGANGILIGRFQTFSLHTWAFPVDKVWKIIVFITFLSINCFAVIKGRHLFKRQVLRTETTPGCGLYLSGCNVCLLCHVQLSGIPKKAVVV